MSDYEKQKQNSKGGINSELQKNGLEFFFNNQSIPSGQISEQKDIKKNYGVFSNINVFIYLIGIFLIVGSFIFGFYYQKSKQSREQKGSNNKLIKKKNIDFRQICTKRFDKKQVFNIENAGKVFGKKDKYMINITKLIPDLQHVWKSVRGQELSDEEAYVLPPHELNKIIPKIDFIKMKNDLIDEIAYQLLEFQESEVGFTKPLMKYQHFKNEQDFQDFLGGLKEKNQKNNYMNDYDFQLAVQLLLNPDDEQLLEAEYYQINKRFKIGQNKNQKPFCILGTSYKLYSRNLYKKFFESIQRQNYTNFHIVYIDDNSPDGSAYKIYDYVRNTNMKIKSKLKIIHTLQSIGAAGNMIFAVQKLCNQDQIVINVDLDDFLIGAQTLKVLNQYYQDQNIWYLYTRFLHRYEKTFTISELSDKLLWNTTEYRRNSTFLTSHLKTWRVKLHRATPLYSYIQYHYNIKNGMGWPTIPTSAGDLAHVYALFELAGNQRIKFINYFAYLYSGPASTSRKCYLAHQRFDARKNYLKTPLKKINNLSQKAYQIQNDIFPKQKFKVSIEANQGLVKCLKS